MKGTIRDDGSQKTGGYRIKSKIFRRLRPGETNYTNFAPGLRILNQLKKIFFALYTPSKPAVVCLFLAIFFLTETIYAVPVFNSPYDSGWYRVNGLAANQDYIRNSSNVLYPFSCGLMKGTYWSATELSYRPT